MRTLAALILSLFLVHGTVLADTPKDADAPAKPAAPKPKAEKKTDKTDANLAAEIEELRQAVQAQQEQLQLLKEELAKRDREIDSAREAAAAANAKASEANTRATEAVNTSAELKSTTSTLSSTVSDVKTGNEALKTTVAKEQADAQKSEENGPATIRYKGVSITPIGFLAAETVTRTKATSADINTPFTSIPYPGASLSKVAETNFTGRQSRAGALVEGKIGSVKGSGYYEADFLGTGVTSNNRQSNSYVLRQRQVWAQAATDSGWIVTGGQMWTLATEYRKGLMNRQEALPMTIDPQYNVGFTWARQYGFRVVKDFGGKFALGISVEGPQATIGGRGFSTVATTVAGITSSTTTNFFINAPGSGGGLYNFVDTANYTVNKTPDIIIKAAADPGFGHYEVFGIISTFRNRIFPCGAAASNSADTTVGLVPTNVPCTTGAVVNAPSAAGAFDDTNVGGGGGASFRVPLFNKKLDLGVKGVAGDGIGRYGSAQLADMTFRPDGSEALIRTAHGLGIVELHPNPKLDIYGYFGAEYAWRAAYVGYTTTTITTTPAIPLPVGAPATRTTTFKTNQIGGYGSPFANNSGCSSEGVPSVQTTSFQGNTAQSPSGGGTCAGDIRWIGEGTIGFWHKFYQGPKGGLRWGIQYSYFTKTGWSGNNGTPGKPTGVGINPHAVDNMVWTSFRYYIP